MAKNGHKCQKMAKRCPKMSKTGKKKAKNSDGQIWKILREIKFDGA